MAIGEWQTRMEIGMKSDRPFMMAPAGRLIPNAVTLIYLSNNNDNNRNSTDHDNNNNNNNNNNN